jgi:hypothetical protein
MPARVRFRFAVLAACIGVGLLAPGRARSCTCLPPPPPLEALAMADAVFTGRVLAAELVQPGFGYVYTIEVYAVWKGPQLRELQVSTTDPSMCGIWLQPGQEFLIFATQQGSSLETDGCGRTKALAVAEEDLDALGGPEAVGRTTVSWSTMKLRYAGEIPATR